MSTVCLKEFTITVDSDPCFAEAGDHDYSIDGTTALAEFANPWFGNSDYRGHTIDVTLAKGAFLGFGIRDASTTAAYCMYYKLTVVNYNAGTKTVTVAAQDWTINGMNTYTVQNLQDTNYYSDIASNTATELVLEDDINVGVGDEIAIRLRAVSTSSDAAFATTMFCTGTFTMEWSVRINGTPSATLVGYVYCDGSNPCPPMVADLKGYYQCEDATGSSQIVDIHAAKNVIGNVPNDVVSGPGIINNSVYINHAYTTLYESAVDSDYWKMSAFTMRFWANVITPLPTTGLWFQWCNNNWGVFHQNTVWELRRGAAGASLGQVTVPLSGWHRIMVWYCGTNGSWGLQLNNDTPVTGTTVLNAAGASSQFRWSLKGDIYIDEVVLWKGLLTTAERLTDWNGGAGVTYPNVPGI